MRLVTEYPTKNIFTSPEWKARAAGLSLLSTPFFIAKHFSLKLALLRTGSLADFETWPVGPIPPIETFSDADAKTDWVVYRKLLAEQTTPENIAKLQTSSPFFSRPFVTPYTVSPYLDLTKPVAHRKSKIAHIQRTERKLTREFAAPVLREFTTTEERAAWFESYATFQRAQNRMSEDQLEVLKTWTLAGEKPEWMLLYGLMVNDVPIAVGLFYYWKGVFYYFSSAMTPDPKFRKYGPGKLFIEKLIQHTIKIGGQTFDFLQGEHDYKAHWNPETRVIYQCIYPRSIKGYVALLLFRGKKLFRKSPSLTAASL